LPGGEALKSNFLIEKTIEFRTTNILGGLRPTDRLNARFRTIQVRPKDLKASSRL
jgi:hypothetical protein